MGLELVVLDGTSVVCKIVLSESVSLLVISKGKVTFDLAVSTSKVVKLFWEFVVSKDS